MNPKHNSSAIALAVSFIDRINHGDVDGLGALMHEAHELVIFDQERTVGREANIGAWWGYATSFPNYLILPSRISARGDTAAVLGTTTGSHLGLPDEEEMKLSLIWLCEVADGLVLRWTLLEDTPSNRQLWNL